MATAAIFHHATTAEQAQTAMPFDAATPGTSAVSGSSDSSTSDDSSTISSNDFLTLLVTEMQNQDPTADTDPNEYISQLVQVNSLEQLIDINQTLSGDASGSATSSSSSTSASIPSGESPSSPTGGANSASGNQGTQAAPGLSPPAWSNISQTVQGMRIGGGSSPDSSGIPPSGLHAHSSPVRGNLGIDKASPAATRVGHALAGRTHAAAVTANPTEK